MNILIYVLFPLSFLVVLVISVFSSDIINYYSYAQATTTTNNITDLLFEKYHPIVEVDYESNSMIVLEGNTNYLSKINGSLVPFWESIDVVTNQGYSLKEITTSGIGNKDNPIIFYAIFFNNSKIGK
jgi:hypothetical protein